MVDQQMAPGVVNVLIDYVLNISDGRLPKQLVEKIAGEWQRKEINTTEKAMVQVKTMLKAKQKREIEKQCQQQRRCIQRQLESYDKNKCQIG